MEAATYGLTIKHISIDDIKETESFNSFGLIPYLVYFHLDFLGDDLLGSNSVVLFVLYRQVPR